LGNTDLDCDLTQSYDKDISAVHYNDFKLYVEETKDISRKDETRDTHFIKFQQYKHLHGREAWADTKRGDKIQIVEINLKSS
jgi:hypothetical protein